MTYASIIYIIKINVYLIHKYVLYLINHNERNNMLEQAKNINYLETLNDYQFTIIEDNMFIIVGGQEINLNDIIESEDV